MIALNVALDRLLEEGRDNVFARHHHLAEGVRIAVAARGSSYVRKNSSVIQTPLLP
jgi:alanine-glyoxylate transaminase/serine-glyoxylate transaminase/serine-pyruvate transaminase